MALAPGTPVKGGGDPRTVEQNATLQRLLVGSDTSALPSAYRGSLLYPDGTLSRDYSVLSKPPARAAEIDAVLAAGTDPAKPSGGYVLILNTDGIPVQYYGCQVPTAATTPAPVVRDRVPTPDTTMTAESANTVNLTQILRLDASDITRTYVKGTLKAITNQTITATNISPDIDIQVAFSPQAGLYFDPSSFLVPPNSSKESLLTFDLAKIDTLPEGLTVFNVPISLTSPTAISPPPVQLPPPAVVNYTPPPVVIYPVIPPAPPSPIPVVPELPPIIIQTPTPVPQMTGQWVLTEVSPAYSRSETIISFNAPENGQEPGERNGYVLGYYNTTYGYTRTTTYGPLYDYSLQGDATAAGVKPTAPVRSVTITEDDDKYQMLSNVFLRPFPTNQIPYIPPPTSPPDEIAVPFKSRLPVIIEETPLPLPIIDEVIIDRIDPNQVVGDTGTFTGGSGGGKVDEALIQQDDGSYTMTRIYAE